MFPLDYKEPYIESTGTRSTLGRKFDEAGADVAQVKTALDNEVLTRAMLGAHNLLPMSLATIKTINSTGTWVDNVYTVNNVSFTVNTDSSGNVLNVTVSTSESASANTDFYIMDVTSGLYAALDDYVGQSVTCTGCPAGGSTNSYSITYARLNATSTPSDTGNGVNVTIADFSGVNAYVRIRIVSGTTATNLVFKPMIRLSSDADTTYQPYAATNKELTTDKLSVATLKSIVADSADFAAFKTAIAAL